MPDLYRPCPADGCDHQENIPPDAEPESVDDPSYADLWDHVLTAHAGGSVKVAAIVMAVTQVIERTNPGDTNPEHCPICGPTDNCRCPKTMQVSNVKFQAMQDGEWVDVPGIASVEIHSDPEPEPAPPRTQSFLAQRLIDRHGIDPEAAAHAVACASRGEDGPHADLIRMEIRALMGEITASMNQALRDLVAALLPAFKAIGEAVQRVGKVTQDDYQLTQDVSRHRERPAWQSPYGPARPNHRPTR